MNRIAMLLVAVAALACASGCGRHVVLSPQDVAARNDPDWRVLCKPNAATATGDAHCSKQ